MRKVNVTFGLNELISFCWGMMLVTVKGLNEKGIPGKKLEETLPRNVPRRNHVKSETREIKGELLSSKTQKRNRG